MSGETFVNLMKWPSLRGERYVTDDSSGPYTVMRGSLRDCVEALQRKPESTHHLYEIHFADGAALSSGDVMALVRQQHDTERR